MLKETQIEQRELARSLVRGAVDEAVAPLVSTILDLERRIVRLETGPAAPAVVASAASPAAHAPGTYEIVMASVVPRAPVLDVAAIERDVHIPIDGAFDGHRRKRRVVATLALVIVVTLGGFVAALVYSYASSDWRQDLSLLTPAVPVVHPMNSRSTPA